MDSFSAKSWGNGMEMQFSECSTVEDCERALHSLCEDMCIYAKEPLTDLSLRQMIAALMAELEASDAYLTAIWRLSDADLTCRSFVGNWRRPTVACLIWRPRRLD